MEAVVKEFIRQQEEQVEQQLKAIAQHPQEELIRNSIMVGYQIAALVANKLTRRFSTSMCATVVENTLEFVRLDMEDQFREIGAAATSQQTIQRVVRA